MKLEDVILRDTRANQPAAGDVPTGTLYYVTDESVTERSSGSTWEDWSDASGGTPAAHATSHENGGSDEIDVSGLSGELADPQPPKTHASDHQSGGGDPIKLDDLAAPDDNTDLNASTSAHGLLVKATAPSSGLRNVVAIDNGETAYTNKALFDGTSPADIGTAATGSAMAAARRDHVHALPDGLVTPAKQSTAGKTRQITFVIDGGGAVIATGAKKAYVSVPWNCTIVKNRVIADQSGGIVIDVLQDSFGSFPPSTSLTASAPPTLSGTQTSEDATLTGWTTSLSAGDVLDVEVDSASDVEKVTLELTVTLS